MVAYRSQSSVTISSGVRWHDSCTRMRPDSAMHAASIAVSSSDTVVPRSPASSSAISTMSIAPRTEDPMRTSGCSRVPRTTLTTRRTKSSSPAASVAPAVLASCTTMASSSSRDW